MTTETTFPVTFDSAFAPATLSARVDVSDADRDDQIGRVDESGRDRAVVKEGQSGIRVLTFEESGTAE